jgi:hypothetical protein
MERERETSAVAASKVTALKHELLNDAVELGAGVAVALLARAQCREVRGGFGHILVI